ncbi:hypothetical protein MKK55_23850 [Methylobacterium sp. J-059]|uniref:hypothetical protein n=1 Tax=Methylobacterium sp. J-059 TaxID=2836643 RepID=UPI001FBA77D6|nr:hypothetical protein [Methylobacterium sp. J-059]MCJ2041964.1 hypothetical protein [Methylobacterium sp. J-059]
MNSHSTDQLAVALAGLRQFLTQPCSAQTLRLLLLAEVGGITRIAVEGEAGGLPVIEFNLEDKDGKALRCRCNPGAYAMLLLIVVCGQSVFVDATNGRRYVKVFGRKARSAGTVFSRLIAGAESEEDFGYADGDTLNLTCANIVFSRNNRRTANDTVENYGEIIISVVDAPDALFPGTPGDKTEAAKQLLRMAMDGLEEDRQAVVRA